MEKQENNINKKTVIIILLSSILVLGSVALAGYFYLKYEKVKINPNTITEQEINNLISNLSNIYIFPSEEKPTIAKISNPELLKDQSFFAPSQENDVVFLFNKSNKVILYRPSEDKIIDISSMKNESEEDVSSPSATIDSIENINF